MQVTLYLVCNPVQTLTMHLLVCLMLEIIHPLGIQILCTKGCFSQSDDYYDTMLAVKRINSADISQVVRKLRWQSGVTYDMWRNDITRDNASQPSGAFDIYSANYYVINSDYRVYICF